MKRVRRALGLATAALALAPAAASAFGTGALANPALTGARLSGRYSVLGIVTKAVGIPDETAGTTVMRTWTFTSPCPSGECAALVLQRQRVGGMDTITLRRLAPGIYGGAGRYTTAVQCDGVIYPAGAAVPYRLMVIVTAAQPAADGSRLATGFTATYSGGPFVGHTRCFQPPAHDAARYAATYVSS